MYGKLWIAALALALPAAAQQSTSAADRVTDPLEEGAIINIVDWDGGQLPKRYYERSDQLPMSLDDVRKLSANKFNSDAIVKMLEERRCVCDASVDALVGIEASRRRRAGNPSGIAPLATAQPFVRADDRPRL